MDHIIDINPYLSSENTLTAEAEQKMRKDIKERQDAEQAEIDRKLEEAKKQVDANNAKIDREVEEERERQAQENAEARQAREYEAVLAESNLEHVRQPNEGAENYIDVPISDDINVTDNDVHNDGELDGEFGRVQKIIHTPLEEIVRAEQEALSVVEIGTPVNTLPEGFVAPPFIPETKE